MYIVDFVLVLDMNEICVAIQGGTLSKHQSIYLSLTYLKTILFSYKICTFLTINHDQRIVV